MSDPIDELNRQIVQFNAERPGDMGITPIDERVSRVEYVAEQDVVRCLDRKGIVFLALKRQADGQFKGVIQAEFHELPKPEGHSWGHVDAEFTLPKGTFVPDDRASSFREAMQKMKAPRPDLSKVSSPALSEALKNAESLWKFMLAPGTPYTARRAAALQGRDAFPVEWLPRLMAAIGELRREGSFHYWGLRQSPLNNLLIPDPERRFLENMPPAQRERRVLGHRWVVPTEALDYPITWEEEAKAPWPWQVQQALDDLFVYARPYDRHDKDKSRAREWLKAAMRMPCATDEEGSLFVEASRWSTHFKTMEVMARWHQIAVHREFAGAARNVGFYIGEAVRLWDDSRSQAVGQVIVVDILRHSPHKEAKHRAAYCLRDFRERFRNGRDVRMPEPATAIIAASQMVIDPKNGDEWTRLYVYAFSVCEALDSPPMKPDRHMDPKSEEVGKALGKFESWFKANRRKLERRAARESAALADVRKAFKSFE